MTESTVKIEIHRIIWVDLRGAYPEYPEAGNGMRPLRTQVWESIDLVHRLLGFLSSQDIHPVRVTTVGGGVYEAGFFEADWQRVSSWLRTQGVSIPCEPYTEWKVEADE